MAARAPRRYGRRTMATTPAAAIPGPLPARRELAIDAALAGIALGITLLTLDRESRALGADAVALSLIAALPILAWRRAPLAVFLLTSAASVATNALGYDLGLGVVPTILVFFVAGMAPAEAPAARPGAGGDLRVRAWARAACATRLTAARTGTTTSAHDSASGRNAEYGSLNELQCGATCTARNPTATLTPTAAA
jgi:hypothetical protein